jgi:hypothetical protein
VSVTSMDLYDYGAAYLRDINPLFIYELTCRPIVYLPIVYLLSGNVALYIGERRAAHPNRGDGSRIF